VSDLGGLGAKEGAPATYFYTPASLGPQVLPWAAILLLLLLKPNRTGRAWWIWLPLLCIPAIEHGLMPQMNFLPSEPTNMFCQIFDSLAFGIAAVWLLSPYLQDRVRFLAFLKMLVATAGFSAVAFLVQQDWLEEHLVFGGLIFICVGALVLMGALSLAGLICRRRYLPLRLLLWLFVLILGGWLVIAGPFAILMSASGGGGEWLEFLTVVVALAALTFVIGLPFLILAFANAFFGERLKTLLQLGREAPPPIITPLPAAGLAS